MYEKLDISIIRAIEIVIHEIPSHSNQDGQLKSQTIMNAGEDAKKEELLYTFDENINEHKPSLKIVTQKAKTNCLITGYIQRQ